jgi:hypothetical protein
MGDCWSAMASLQVEYVRPDRVYNAVRGGTAELFDEKCGLVSFPEANYETSHHLGVT